MNNSVMHHKGYSAAIRFSEEDGVFVGRILGITDIVNFHGDSVDEIKRQFSIALDSYLSDCAEMGKDPDRPYSGKLNLRLTPECHKAIAFEAESSGMSINDVVVAALERSYMNRGAVRRRATAARKSPVSRKRKAKAAK